MANVILESLYAPTAKDRLSGINQTRYSERISVTGDASITLSLSFRTIPPDTARILTHVFWTLTPQAAVVPIRCAISTAQGIGIYQGGTINPPVLAGVPWFQGISLGEGVLMLPGEVPFATATWSAGNVANVFTAGLLGYDIPRANLQGVGSFGT